MITEILENRLAEIRDEAVAALREIRDELTSSPVAKYQVVRSADAGEVASEVNSMIDKGWQPVGHMAVAARQHNFVYVQTMVWHEVVA